MQQDTPAGAPIGRLTLASVVSVLVAASAVVAGMAVLAGWLYTRQYYRQFGIEPSALSFSPYDYALRARQALGVVLSASFTMLLGAAAAVALPTLPGLHWLRRSHGPEDERGSDRAVRYAAILATFGVLGGLGIADWFTTRSGMYLIVAVLGLLVWAYMSAGWLLQGKEERAFVGGISMIVILAMLVLYVPGAQGESDGRVAHDHLERLPAVSLVAGQEIGLPQHELAGAFHRYGPYRLVLHNGGMYYFVAEDEPGETLAVPEQSISYLQFHAER